MSPRRVLLTGHGELIDGLREGLAARDAQVRCAWPGAADRAGFTAALDDIGGQLGGLDLVAHGWIHPDALVPTPVVELSEQRWAQACEATIDAAFRLAQAAHPFLAASRGRLVFLVPSVALSGADGLGALSAAGEAIRVLAKGIAKTWGSSGITVNTVVVAPQHLLGEEAGAAATRGQSLSPPALGSHGDAARDLAPVLDLLAGEDAHFVTGATLVLDGGVWTAQ